MLTPPADAAIPTEAIPLKSLKDVFALAESPYFSSGQAKANWLSDTPTDPAEMSRRIAWLHAASWDLMKAEIAVREAIDRVRRRLEQLEVARKELEFGATPPPVAEREFRQLLALVGPERAVKQLAWLKDRANSILQQEVRARGPHPVIVWDGKRRLFIDGDEVKKYPTNSTTQKGALDAFQAAGWPVGQPVDAGLRGDQRKETIKSLNRSLSHTPLRFRPEGDGVGIVTTVAR